uniref:Uncharacterized protein n=1 Tax=Clastoptera arizonana TaxID=38151 RepID=A0A1B6CH75_9HEMI
MADISKDELRKEITAVLKDADLSTMSAKKVRQQIEEKLSIDLTSRKKEVDDIVMNCLKEQGKKGEKKKNGSKKKDDDDEDDDEEGEDDEEEEEEEDDEEEDDDKPAKRAANKKPVAVKRKNSSDESEDDDDKESDEEYSPSKKAKGRPKGKGAGKGRKKKGSDSDSDEDWGKGKKASSGGAKKGGGAKRAGGYTKVCTLSPELAAVVGQDSMARHEVVKKVWAIIKEKNLYDPKNKQYAICNDELLKVFGVKRFRTFGMMKFLKNHFVD